MKTSTALDWTRQNKEIQSAIKEGIAQEFPIESNKRILEVSDLRIEDTIGTDDYPHLKELKLNRKSFTTPIYGKVTLKDKETGEIINTIDKFKLANVPKLTRWYSMIIDGNEYQTVNQLRLKSGIYTREKENGDFESRFNLEKGFNFTMILPPERGIFYLVTKNAKYRLYNLLSSLGVPETEMLKLWGKEILAKNVKGAKNTEHSEITQLYKELTKNETTDALIATKGIKDYFDTTKVSPVTTKITLGNSHAKVSAQTLLDTSKKLLAVMKGEDKVDERESLIFKDMFGVEDSVTQYFNKNKESLVGKVKFRMDKKDNIREIISPDTYSKPIKSFFTQGDLSATSEQTNPAQILADAQKVTFMGTGGIGSRHAITTEVRDLHPTHLGFIDPVSTPESSKAGVNIGLNRDIVKDGKDLKTTIKLPNGERVFKTVAEFYDMKIAFGDQYATINRKIRPIGKTVKGVHRGKNMVFKASEVEGWMLSPSNMFSYVTNAIPYMAHDSGNRLAMATRMLGQAIPIIDREEPFTQTKWKGEETFQKLIGSFMNPAPGPGNYGTVSKVDEDYVHIKLDKPNAAGETKIKVGLFNNYPLNQESFINSEVKVKVGDKVKPNTFLADSNFSKNDTLSLGANINVAYMP